MDLGWRSLSARSLTRQEQTTYNRSKYTTGANRGQACDFTKVSVIVERSLKVGNFTVSFTDLSIPVAGVPMEVTRTYDTRDKRVGDFGFGWTLGLHNIRVEKSSVIGLKWFESVSQEFLPNYCLDPLGSHVVTVTFPGGKVLKFQASVTPHCQRSAPITSANISFAPCPGPSASWKSWALPMSRSMAAYPGQ